MKSIYVNKYIFQRYTSRLDRVFVLGIYASLNPKSLEKLS